ncbi:MAG: GAF domain-containing sensor histidine kinase [Pseudomonadota bacterium]
MDPGQGITKEQSFWPKELREGVYRYIPLSWVTAGAGFFGAVVAYLLGLDFPFGFIIIIFSFILISNAIFLLIGRRWESLRRFKDREMMRMSQELEISRTRLTSLYEMIKEVGSHSNLQQLMDSAVLNASRIMGVKACSIKLLDTEKKCLRFASTYGLSEDYLNKDYISIEESGINRQILEGSRYSIGHIDEESHFQYPEDIRREGIASMLCLPLKVDQKILGILCVYSPQSNYFTESDGDFFYLVTALTALSMEKLRQESSRTWFLNKAAHQLSSPLNAVQSLLSVLEGGYLGPVSEPQQEKITRCRKRLGLLQDTINDLLKLASERREIGRPELSDLDAAAVLNGLKPLFLSQAQEKNIRLEFEMPIGVPRVLGQKIMIEDLFSNLISNAVKYTPAGGRVTVTLSPFSFKMIRFDVADTGIGIPKLEQSSLLTEFFRAENAKAMTEEGTGLGLVIVKEILDLIGGSIRLESKEGQGTHVSCLLPAAATRAG